MGEAAVDREDEPILPRPTLLGGTIASSPPRADLPWMNTNLAESPHRNKTLLIVYHTLTGGSRQMASAAAEAARREPGIRVELRHARETDDEHVLLADGYIFAGPENLGAISGMLKDFFDRCYYPALDRVNGRPYVSLICAGSDGHNAARQIERIATGWRLKAIAPPVIVCTHAQTTETILRPKQIAEADLERCRETGSALAAGMALGVF